MSIEPKRYKVPTDPGVYRGYRADVDLEIYVQLDDIGQWWPWPYSFNGWRASEISLFELTRLPNHDLDVPEIHNPHLREAVETFIEDLLFAFPEISDVKRAKAFAINQLKGLY